MIQRIFALQIAEPYSKYMSVAEQLFKLSEYELSMNVKRRVVVIAEQEGMRDEIKRKYPTFQ